MIKPFLLVCALAFSLSGADKFPSLMVRMEGEALLTYKILQQTLASMGVQGEIRRFSSDTSISEMEIVLTSKRGYDPKRLLELLKERSVSIVASNVENNRWQMDLDMREAILDIPSINEDSSAQMQRSIYSYWFEVGGARYITIDAPYEGAWYPEIAVLDGNMQVLHSSKKMQPESQMTFELPEGSKYLKVSNSHGMHLMKEGLWVSAEHNEN